jgi:hypothetical protein
MWSRPHTNLRAWKSECGIFFPLMNSIQQADLEIVYCRLGQCNVSKWFYDTLTGAAPGIRWTRRFTWFELPERNTLRLRVNRVVLLCLSARLRSSLFSLSARVCSPPRPSSAWTFYSQGRVITGRPHGPTGGPGAGRPLKS